MLIPDGPWRWIETDGEWRLVDSTGQRIILGTVAAMPSTDDGVPMVDVIATSGESGVATLLTPDHSIAEALRLVPDMVAALRSFVEADSHDGIHLAWGMARRVLERLDAGPVTPDTDEPMSVGRLGDAFDRLGTPTTEPDAELTSDPDEYPLF